MDKYYTIQYQADNDQELNSAAGTVTHHSIAVDLDAPIRSFMQ